MYPSDGLINPSSGPAEVRHLLFSTNANQCLMVSRHRAHLSTPASFFLHFNVEISSSFVAPLQATPLHPLGTEHVPFALAWFGSYRQHGSLCDGGMPDTDQRVIPLARVIHTVHSDSCDHAGFGQNVLTLPLRVHLFFLLPIKVGYLSRGPWSWRIASVLTKNSRLGPPSGDATNDFPCGLITKVKFLSSRRLCV